MIFACDIDGVVADLLTVWLQLYNKDYNDNLKKHQITDWDTTLFVKPECGNSIYSYLDYKLLYTMVKAIPGAKNGIAELRKLGRVVFVTDSVLAQAGNKFSWLKEHEMITSKDDYVEAKDKSLILADFLIDDYVGNLSVFTGTPIMFSQPWNAKYENFKYRAQNWKQVIQIVKGLIL